MLSDRWHLQNANFLKNSKKDLSSRPPFDKLKQLKKNYGAESTMAERKYFNMKKDIHPDYRQVVFMDTTTGYQFLSGSTKHSNETVEFEGETYPLIRVEISSDSHPFYTGRQKFTQADGRVDRFNKKYGLK